MGGHEGWGKRTAEGRYAECDSFSRAGVESHLYIILACPATDASKESIGVDYTFEQLEKTPSAAWDTGWALEHNTINSKLLSDGLAIPDKNQGAEDTHWYKGKSDALGVTYMFN